MPNLPSIAPYVSYSSDNYGAHALKVSFDNLTLYYSYKTVVAFRAGGELKVSENQWGPTTGKHLNAIDSGNKSRRLPREQFETELQSTLEGLGLSER